MVRMGMQGRSSPRLLGRTSHGVRTMRRAAATGRGLPLGQNKQPWVVWLQARAGAGSKRSGRPSHMQA